MDKFLEQASCVPTSTIDKSLSNTNIIKFNAGDTNFCHKITKKNVKIICSAGEHDHGSSKVKLKNIVDYKWEVKKYPGHLIAVHMDGKHMAYVIKVNNKQSGTEEGMVRVVNTVSSQRALIKGVTGEVLDVQFAHILRIHILACIDINSLYVYKIDMLSENLICNLLLKIEDPLENYLSKYNKISWCPFYQEEYSTSDDEGDDASQLIVWSRGKIFQCFNVNNIINSHGIGKHHPKDLTDGYVQSFDSSILITWVSLSPDGTTLSIGSEDGLIRFYQVYFHEKQQRCLHQWKPHNGKPISSFFFLDNFLKKSSSDTFWKHALTGSNFNTEFKIWDCGTWECLQQIQLVPTPSDDGTPFELNLTAEIDITSSYLVLTNISTRTLYILQISNNNNNNNNESGNSMDTSRDKPLDLCANKISKKYSTYIRSVSEFPVSSAILSYSIVNASIRKLYKCAINDSYLLDDEDYDYDDESNAISCVVVRMFVVQPKSVQECHILYEPVQINAGDEDDNNDFLCNDVKSLLNSDIENNLIDVTKLPYKDTLVSAPNKTNKILQLLDKAYKPLKVSNIDLQEFFRSSETEDTITKSCLIDDNNLVKKNQKSPSPLIPGLPNLEAPQACHDEPTTAPVIVPPVASASTLNHAQKSHFSQINLMTPDSFSASTSASGGMTMTGGGGKKSPSDSVSSDVLSMITMLASVTGSQNTKNNSENLNLLNFMNNKMIEDQEYQKQFLKSAATDKKIHQQEKKDDRQSDLLINSFVSLDNEDEEDNDNDVIIESQNNSEILTSGGSSPPSREVQEIMSLKDNDIKISKFSFNDSQDLSLQKLPQIPDKFLNTGEITNTKTQQLIKKGNTQNNIKTAEYKTNNKDDIDNRNNKASSNDNWPKIPDITSVGNKKLSQQKHRHSNELLPSPSILEATNTNLAANFRNPGNLDTDSLKHLTTKIDHLINIIQLQSTQINGLQTEVKNLKGQKDLMNTKNQKQDQANFIEMNRQGERQFQQNFEKYMKRYGNENRNAIDEFVKLNQTTNFQLHEKIHQENEIFLKQLHEKIAQTIKFEMQRNVVQVLLVKLDAIKGEIQSDVSRKLNANDNALRENITQLCKSKSIIETFGKSVLHGVQGSLQAAFIESMSSTLIPAYEKSSQNMFRQLHETFSKGINQVMEQFDKYLKQLQPVQDTTDEILKRCLKFRELMEQNLTRQSNSISDNFMDTKKDIKSLEINFVRHFSDLMKKEIRKNFEMQVASIEDSVLCAVRSQANTPAPSHVLSVYDVQDQIKHLLSSGQINAAFHQALLANDLNLVEYTLEKADYKTVFNPCTLEQTVLLSLIQQITADMTQHNEVKQKYLADGILNLNPSDPITKEHAPKVMKELYRNCQSFLSLNPKSALYSNVRMIMMAIQGISSLADNSFL